MMRKKPNYQGFTLLEVLAALFIVALALGTVMALSGSSKRLALKAQIGLERTLYERAALNAAQAQYKPEYPKYPEEYADHASIEQGSPLPRPARQTTKILYVLEPYTISSGKTQESSLQGLHWRRLPSLQ